MNISGVLLHAQPQQISAVSSVLESLQGVEVHAKTEQGKIVVTIEQPDNNAMSDTLLQLQNLPGVYSAAMIYHQFEDTSNE